MLLELTAQWTAYTIMSEKKMQQSIEECLPTALLFQNLSVDYSLVKNPCR